jgi:hypothetical protein
LASPFYFVENFDFFGVESGINQGIKGKTVKQDTNGVIPTLEDANVTRIEVVGKKDQNNSCQKGQILLP